jgi:hypothetical protein
LLASTDDSGQTTFALEGGSAGPAVRYQLGGDDYILPADAAAYLESGQLSTSLFDVSALLRASTSDDGRIPVTLTYSPGAAVTAPPGVTLTSVGGQTAQGFVTDASEAELGTALHGVTAADIAAHLKPGSTPIVNGLTSIARTGAASNPTASGSSTGTGTGASTAAPLYAMHTLQINTLDINGNAGDPFPVFLVNTDNMEKEAITVPVYDSVARVEVPAGHYALSGFYLDLDADYDVTATRVVAVNDFTVPNTSGVTDVTLDERTATNLVTVGGTPRPATQDYSSVEWNRTDAEGSIFSAQLGGSGTTPMYTNTQPTARTGTAQLFVQWGGAGTDPGPAYRYDLAFERSGMPADETYTPTARDLATVTDDYSLDPGGQTGGVAWIAALPAGLPGQLYQISTPPTGQVTDYVQSAQDTVWSQMYASGLNVILISDSHAYTAGRTYSAGWGHGPLAPNFGNHTGETSCAGCGSGASLTLQPNEIGDSTPDHRGFSPENVDYALYVNGSQALTSTYLPMRT